jgi:hypothetical protein
MSEFTTISALERTFQEDGLDFPRVVATTIGRLGVQTVKGGPTDKIYAEQHEYIPATMPGDVDEQLIIADTFTLSRGAMRNPSVVPTHYGSASVRHETVLGQVLKAETELLWQGSSSDMISHMGRLVYAGARPELQPEVGPKEIDAISPWDWKHTIYRDSLGARSLSIRHAAFAVKYMPQYLERFPPHNFSLSHLDWGLEDVNLKLSKAPEAAMHDLCTPGSVNAFMNDREMFRRLTPIAVSEALNTAYLRLREPTRMTQNEDIR